MSTLEYQTPNTNTYSTRPTTSSPVSFFIQNPRNSPVLLPISGMPLQSFSPVWCPSPRNQTMFELQRSQSKNEKTNQRMESKTQVEKVAIQALCLLGSCKFFDDQLDTLFEAHNTNNKTLKKHKKQKKVKRKRSFEKKQFETIGTKITVTLCAPINKRGSFKIKSQRGAPKFATPSTYPRPTGLRIKKN
ncbi:hypothetical protein M0813_06313 [Anaeramoeba flamelloides]|uniref:Uncharacterized protein n=1 Tax=Anaeramoeba flamelloides TaxID=1746091 RepID=A0ABQ8XEJ1_9EUKA|nr:hypothetical protein M0813_06313 [Anaeramoeba flamelloides]